MDGEVPKKATSSGFAVKDGVASFPKAGTKGRRQGKWGGGNVSSVPDKYNFRGQRKCQVSSWLSKARPQRNELGQREMWTF